MTGEARIAARLFTGPRTPARRKRVARALESRQKAQEARQGNKFDTKSDKFDTKSDKFDDVREGFPERPNGTQVPAPQRNDAG